MIHRILSGWDLALLDRHGRFYAALAKAEQTPRTALQAHFVAVVLGHAQAATQHEIAFQRFREGWIDPRHQSPGADPRSTPTTAPSRHTERAVDLADLAQVGSRTVPASRIFRRITALHTEGAANARRASADAALWISTALADEELARPAEQWTSATFGQLSDVYTKAVDGSFVAGPKSGAEYVSPWLHRLFDGHTPDAAWRAVRDALPDDTVAEEVVGWLRALGSDFTTVVGLPVKLLTPADYEHLKALVCESLGVSEQWLIDVLHTNAVEGVQFTAGCLPMVAAVMGWSRSDAETFARLAAGLGIGALAAGNPLLILVALATLAKAYELGRSEGRQGLWKPILEGSVPAGTALGLAAMTAASPLTCIAAGLVVSSALRDSLKSRAGFHRSDPTEGPAARIVDAFAKLGRLKTQAFPAL